MGEKDLIDALESLKLKGSNVERGRFGESYRIDKATGAKFIVPTKRADGSLRKEIKVRPGYLPPEERQVYVPVHRRSPKEFNNGMPVVAKRLNGKSRQSFKQPPRNIKPANTETKIEKPEFKNNQELRKKQEPRGNQEFKNKQDLKTKSEKVKPKFNVNNNKTPKNKLKVTSSEKDTITTTTPLNTEKDNSTKSNQNPQENTPELTDKRLKNSINNTLRKIREVKSLQEKVKNGVELDPNQQKKVNRLEELEQKLSQLRSLDKWDLKNP